jgi:hypothetical protein
VLPQDQLNRFQHNNANLAFSIHLPRTFNNMFGKFSVNGFH